MVKVNSCACAMMIYTIHDISIYIIISIKHSSLHIHIYLNENVSDMHSYLPNLSSLSKLNMKISVFVESICEVIC